MGPVQASAKSAMAASTVELIFMAFLPLELKQIQVLVAEIAQNEQSHDDDAKDREDAIHLTLPFINFDSAAKEIQG
jgi:hypothetical protein